MPNPFTIKKETRDDLTIIELEGYLDAHTAPQFEQEVQEAIDGGHYRLIVDCARLTYISSAGLGVFMSFIEEVREQDGGDIKICSLSPKVKSVFEILGFAALYDLCDDVPDAIKRFSLASAKEA